MSKKKKKKIKQQNSHDEQLMMQRALEILAYSAFFMIEQKVGVGKAEVAKDEEMKKIYAAFVRDVKALQWEQYCIIKTNPKLSGEICKAIMTIIENMDGGMREQFAQIANQVDKSGREALRIPDKVILELDAQKQKALMERKKDVDV